MSPTLLGPDHPCQVDEDCDEPSVVAVNGLKACVEHIDVAMGKGFAPVKQALRELK